MVDFAIVEQGTTQHSISEVQHIHSGEAGSPAVVENLPTQVLSQDEYLFREGDLKRHAYRVESGVLCVTSKGPHGTPEFIELAFPGDLVGLGFLDRYVDSAAALVETKVSLWSLQALPLLSQASVTAETRQAGATEREFLARRRQLVASTADSPLRRVAAFLTVLSRLNEIEGRDPAVISESLRSGDVAAFLNMDVEVLAGQLLELQQRELVSLTGKGGLRLEKPADLEGLAAVAN